MLKLLKNTQLYINHQQRTSWTKVETLHHCRGTNLASVSKQRFYNAQNRQGTPTLSSEEQQLRILISESCRRCSTQGFHKYRDIMNVPEGIFSGRLDRFNGITVESSVEYETNVNFSAKLKKSLDFWLENKRRGIWFKVNTEHSEWIPHLARQQFDFHHAKHGFVVMFRWLPTDEDVNIPVFAHTMVGVGGLVINPKNEILVVSERHAIIPNSWKLPGGYVEPGEDWIDAAIREVREETGIECKFDTMVCMRQAHRRAFGCSDLYIVVALAPLNDVLKRCEREIAKIQWMPLQEFLQHPNVEETNRHFVRTRLDYNERGIRFTCEKAKHQILHVNYNLYFMQKQIQKREDSEEKLES